MVNPELCLRCLCIPRATPSSSRTGINLPSSILPSESLIRCSGDDSSNNTNDTVRSKLSATVVVARRRHNNDDRERKMATWSYCEAGMRVVGGLDGEIGREMKLSSKYVQFVTPFGASLMHHPPRRHDNLRLSVVDSSSVVSVRG